MQARESGSVRQAVVIIHGMGEQRPLETLNGFIRTGMQPDDRGQRVFYSRPDLVTNSYESRRYLAPKAGVGGRGRTQTEFYEYHWAHLMQGNLLTDLVTPVRRMLVTPPWMVPNGLRVVWAAFWAVVIASVWLFLANDGFAVDWGSVGFDDVLRALAGGGLVALVLTYLVTHVLPSWLTSSFVDVVRYLDTSPRSYAVRHDIRKGILELLNGLHQAKEPDGSQHYQRIIIVAHSLGTYIAYDAIGFLWAQMNKLHAGPMESGTVGSDPTKGTQPDGLRDLEVAASALVDPPGGSMATFRAAQKKLWLGLRAQHNPWLITDFVSVGSPMYFAHRLWTRNSKQFADRVEKRELPLCPPLADRRERNKINGTSRWYSWNNGGRRVLYEGAPFAVVRWTNMWYPPRLSFFGDWFGGRLAPLFGPGIEDIPISGDRPWRLIPAVAHALYFSFAESTAGDSATAKLRGAMDLIADDWLQPTVGLPPPDPATA
jgi:hypothetical protein